MNPTGTINLANLAIALAEVLAALTGVGLLALAILRVGVQWVRDSGKVAHSIEGLTGALQKIEGRVDAYISREERRDEGHSEWKMAVEARLSGIEATLKSLNQTVALILSPSVRGRRGQNDHT